MTQDEQDFREIVAAVLEGMGVNGGSPQLISNYLDFGAAHYMVLSLVKNQTIRLSGLGYEKFELQQEVVDLKDRLELALKQLSDKTMVINMSAEEKENMLIERQDLMEKIHKQKERIEWLENELRAITASHQTLAMDRKDAGKDVQYITRFFADFFAMIMSEQNGYGLIRKLMNSKSHPAAFNSFVNSIQDEDRVGAVRMLVSIFGLTGEAASTVVDVLIQNESTKNVKLMGRKRGSTIAKKG